MMWECVNHKPIVKHVLYLVPLFHFLRGYTKPGKPVKCFDQHRQKDGSWYGIKGLQDLTKTFKKSMDYGAML